MIIEGPIFALVTPFEKNGDVCYSALSDYLDFLAGKNVRNIVVNGTTGEFASLTLRERQAVLEFCRIHFKGKIINNISTCSVGDSLQLLSWARDYADAVLLLPPFYYANVSSSGIALFLETILESCDTLLFLYNFPQHCRISIESQMLKKLGQKYPCLAGIKDSGGDIENSKSYKSANPNLQVFVGADSAVLEVLDSGLDGSVTGGGNPVPECLLSIHESFTKGDKAKADRDQKVFNTWTDFRRSIQTSEISLAKAGLNARVEGFPIYTRPPLLHENGRTIKLVSKKLKKDILPLLA